MKLHKKNSISVILLLIFLLSFVSESQSYLLSARVIGLGSSAGRSSAYQLRGVVRPYYLRRPAGANLTLGEGFLRSVYFSGQVILAPIVILITPSSAANTGPVAITNLGGANFLPGATVRLSKNGQANINATGVSVINAGEITCTFDLTGAAGGAWDATVTNPDGRSGTLPSAFTITYPAPTITSVSPRKGINNQAAFDLQISGAAFRPAPTISLSMAGEADLNGTAVVWASAAELTARFDLAGKPTGLWDVKVTNNDGQSGTLSQCFQLEAPTVEIVKPVEITVTPNPNYPAVKSTSIKYNLSKDAEIIIDVYSMRGEKIWSRTVAAGTPGAQVGLNEVVWDGLTAFKSVAGSGVYLIYISSRTETGTKLLAKQKLGIIK
jgi:hypothetical protein